MSALPHTNDYSISICDVPVDCLEHIITYLHPSEIIESTHAVCRLFKDISESDDYWEKQFWADATQYERSELRCIRYAGMQERSAVPSIPSRGGRGRSVLFGQQPAKPNGRTNDTFGTKPLWLLEGARTSDGHPKETANNKLWKKRRLLLSKQCWQDTDLADDEECEGSMMLRDTDIHWFSAYVNLISKRFIGNNKKVATSVILGTLGDSPKGLWIEDWDDKHVVVSDTSSFGKKRYILRFHGGVTTHQSNTKSIFHQIISPVLRCICEGSNATMVFIGSDQSRLMRHNTVFGLNEQNRSVGYLGSIAHKGYCEILSRVVFGEEVNCLSGTSVFDRETLTPADIRAQFSELRIDDRSNKHQVKFQMTTFDPVTNQVAHHQQSSKTGKSEPRNAGVGTSVKSWDDVAKLMMPVLQRLSTQTKNQHPTIVRVRFWIPFQNATTGAVVFRKVCLLDCVSDSTNMSVLQNILETRGSPMSCSNATDESEQSTMEVPPKKNDGCNVKRNVKQPKGSHKSNAVLARGQVQNTLGNEADKRTRTSVANILQSCVGATTALSVTAFCQLDAPTLPLQTTQEDHSTNIARLMKFVACSS